MGNTQVDAVPKEGGIAKGPILPAEFRAKAFKLTIAAGESKKLSDAANFSDETDDHQLAVVRWTIMNDTGVALRLGGEEADATTGLLIPAALLPALPVYLAGDTDPGSTYLFNTGGVDVTINILFVADFA